MGGARVAEACLSVTFSSKATVKKIWMASPHADVFVETSRVTRDTVTFVRPAMVESNVAFKALKRL